MSYAVHIKITSLLFGAHFNGFGPYFIALAGYIQCSFSNVYGYSLFLLSIFSYQIKRGISYS